MEISSEFVGTRSLPFEVELTPRRIMNFAAATSDNNSCYFDDLRPEGIAGPPMMAVALTWPVSEQFGTYWPDRNFPLEVLTRQVHYSEYLEWFAPLRPGDRYTIGGEVKAILPHRGGTHLIIEYQARKADGTLVFLERIGGLLRGVKCLDKGKGGEFALDLTKKSGFESPMWEAAIPIDPLAAHVYDGCADIHFPIHSSVAFAQKVGLPGPLYQGTATLSLAVREITNREAGGDPKRLRGVSCLFTGMVFPASVITLRILARESAGALENVFFTVLNADNKTAIRDGCLQLAS